MRSQNYDDPKIEMRWLKEQRRIVQEYLDKQEIRLVKVEEKATWFVAPYVALWRAVNLKNCIWIVSGDLPTDYFEAQATQSPREMLAAFGRRWKSMGAEMLEGNLPPDFHIGKIKDQKELGALLKARAQILLNWSKDKGLWQ